MIGTIWKGSKQVYAALLAYLLKVAKGIRRWIPRVLRWLYIHGIVAPHASLLRWRWYSRWHKNRYHTIVHWSVAATGGLVVVMLGVMLQVATNALSDLSDTWNFSNPSDYVADSGVEITGGTARLKAQNYADDANTSALYHLDEANGATGADSSSNNNPLAVSGATFGAGNLNNALSFNGTTNKALAPDTTANSLSQKNSVEAWTKFNSSFSAESSDHKQTVLDKGDYKLYYDNGTGKVSYELSNSGMPTWTQNASATTFRDNTVGSVSATDWMGSDMYAGLGGESGGDARVWKWNGTTWTMVGGNGLNGSWSSATGAYKFVRSLEVVGSDVYVGIDSSGTSHNDTEVWKYNGTTWTKIGDDAAGAWGAFSHYMVRSLVSDGTNVYASIGSINLIPTNTAYANEVWKWDGITWTKIGGGGVNGGWNTYGSGLWSASTLYYLNGKLYAGFVGQDGAVGNYYGTEVWGFNTTANTWTRIGGSLAGTVPLSPNSSWVPNRTYRSPATGIRAMGSDGTNLYVGLYGNGQSANSGGTDVWKWNGTTWSRIGGDGLNGSWNDAMYDYEIDSFAWDGTNLYAGLGGYAWPGYNELWKWNGTTWSRIGGNGTSGNWNGIGYTVSSVSVNDNKVYASVSGAMASGELWQRSGTTWTKIGGSGVNGSWQTNKAYGVTATTTFKGSTYAGTGYYGQHSTYPPGTGDAQVFKYSASDAAWVRIGGNGVNGSWSATNGMYYTVASLVSQGDNLYAGLHGVSGDVELWRWNGTAWAKIAGDGVNGSWNGGTYTGVYSMAFFGGNLYAGIGGVASTSDGELWKYDGTTWTKVGGDGANGSWATGYAVASLIEYDGNLMVGTWGSGASVSGELWRYTGSAWTKIGGSSVNGSWSGFATPSVTSLAVNDGKLYVGLGVSTVSTMSYGSGSPGSVYQYDGTSWTAIGPLNWSVKGVASLVTYGGALYASTSGNYEVSQAWRWTGSGTNWVLVGGPGSASVGSWATGLQPPVLTVADGRLYAGLGTYTPGGASVYSLASSSVLQSTTTSWDTNWHHIAATYDGETMKLYIDGVLNNSKVTALSLPDSNMHLAIGNGIGTESAGDARTGGFDGSIDEVRISNQARTSFNFKPYVATSQAVTLGAAVRKYGVWHWDNLSDTETTHGGVITYRLSSDGGVSWRYWNGTDWVTSTSLEQSNDATVTGSHIATFPVTFDGIMWQAVLKGDGTQQVTLNGVSIDATSDYTPPAMGSSAITAAKTAGGDTLVMNAWTNGASPAFSWDNGLDGESGVKGYCAYFGTSDTADPITTKGMLGNSQLATGEHCQFVASAASLNTAVAGTLATQMSTSNAPYYLILKAIDSAGNVSADSVQFHFRFDNTPPSAPGYIAAPSGYINTKDATLTWPTSDGGAPNDANAGLAGLQYRIGATGTWYGDSHTGSGSMGDLLVNDGVYRTTETPDYANLQEGVNTVYFRTWDNAGNVSATNATAALKINTSGAPTEPQNLTANPATNTTNAFAFSWDEPGSYVGDSAHISYCYTVNTLPSEANCTFTSPGVKSLGAGPYATQPGANTLYVIAKDESGNVNYGAYASTQFTANTPSPGIPLNVDIADVSIKATQNWRLALTWEAPTNLGAGVSVYKVYRSTDSRTFSLAGSSASTSFIDTNLTNQAYYYKIEACDNTNNCGAFGTVISLVPTGKFTSAADMVAEPRVTGITTKKATVNWSTDRSSDSKIAIGTTSGKYGSSEISNSTQSSAHELQLDNLAAGTTYYYVAKWTDEDGNMGTSQEYTFTTAPPPTLKEITVTNISLASATVSLTSKNAAKVSVYYGVSADAFAGVQSVNTSASESTYTMSLNGLTDGTKYYYKLVSYDSEGTTYDGSVASFTTPQRPKIANLKFQPVDGEPTSTQRITWTTNVPATSTVTYGKVGTLGTDVQLSTMTTEHEVVVRDLDDDSQYFLTANSRDANGNLAESDRQVFHTALDTRPPKISNISVEATIRGTGAEARGQVVVSWHTDELATSQVAYGEGAGITTFNNKTAEDTGLSFEHIVIISDLPTSKVYSVQPLAKDSANNQGKGTTQSAIIGRASDSVLTIVLNVLKGVFGL